MWEKWVFYGPENSVFGPKFFCQRTPNFVNGPFVALGETVHFQPLDRFLFLIYGRFRKKKEKKLHDAPKSLTPPHWGSKGWMTKKTFFSTLTLWKHTMILGCRIAHFNIFFLFWHQLVSVFVISPKCIDWDQSTSRHEISAVWISNMPHVQCAHSFRLQHANLRIWFRLDQLWKHVFQCDLWFGNSEKN